MNPAGLEWIVHPGHVPSNAMDMVFAPTELAPAIQDTLARNVRMRSTLGSTSVIAPWSALSSVCITAQGFMKSMECSRGTSATKSATMRALLDV